MKKTKAKELTTTCKTCGLVSPLSEYRDGLTGKVTPFPDGSWVAICPQCGCVTEVNRKGDTITQRIMTTSEVMQCKHAEAIMAEAIPIGLRFIDENPEHPAVQRAQAAFNLIKDKLNL